MRTLGSCPFMVWALPLWIYGGLFFAAGSEGARVASRPSTVAPPRPLLSQSWGNLSCGPEIAQTDAQGSGAAHDPSRVTFPYSYEPSEPEVGLSAFQCPNNLHADALHQVPWMVGTMQPSKVKIPVAEEKTGCQQKPEQYQEGRGKAVRDPGIYAAFFYEVGWTGSTMAEIDTRWTACQSPGGGQSRTSTTTTVAASSQASRRVAGGGTRGQSSHRKLAEEHGVSICPKAGAGHHCRCQGQSQGPQAGDYAYGPQQGQTGKKSVRCCQGSIERGRWQVVTVQPKPADGVQHRARGLPQEEGICLGGGESQEGTSKNASGHPPFSRVQGRMSQKLQTYQSSSLESR